MEPLNIRVPETPGLADRRRRARLGYADPGIS